jgi:hypothetical protein
MSMCTCHLLEMAYHKFKNSLVRNTTQVRVPCSSRSHLHRQSCKPATSLQHNLAHLLPSYSSAIPTRHDAPRSGLPSWIPPSRPCPSPTSHPVSTAIAMDDGCVDCGGAAATRASHCAAGDPKGAHLCDDQGHGNRSKPAIRSSLQKCSGCRPEAAGMTGPRRAIPDPDSVPVPLRRDAGPSRRFLLLDDFL